MTWRRHFAKIGALIRRSKPADDLTEEIRAHLEMEERENRERGMPPDEAHFAALRRFGNVTEAQERSREMWKWQWLETLLQDIRYGLRQLRRNPGFTGVAVITLALGIGANTAVFSVVYAVLLRPLPFDNPGQLVTLWERNPKEGYDQNFPAAANYLDWRAQNNVFSQMAAFDAGQIDITGTARPERLAGATVTASLFELLRVHALLGRTFLSEEEQPGHEQVVVLSYGLWHQRFNGDRGVLGKTITIDQRKCTVIGVMPPGFVFPGDTGTVGIFTTPAAQLWMPLALTTQLWSQRSDHYLSVIARTKPGVRMSRAIVEMDAIERSLVERYPNEFIGTHVKIVPLHLQVESGLRPVLLVLFGSVGFVLLVACANVANLLLARACARKKEMTVRAALGANRSRIIRQMVTESLLLSAAGGTGGIFLARVGLDTLKAMIPANFPQGSFVSIDGWVLVFTALVAFLTPMVFGLAPTLQTSKTHLIESLTEGGRGPAEGIHDNQIRSVLVISEVALSLVLLIGAGLMIRSFIRLQDVSPGFNPERVLTLQISLPKNKFAQDEQRRELIQQLTGRLKSLPGVKFVGATTLLPLSGTNDNSAVRIQGMEVNHAEHGPSASVRIVTPEYFQALGIPLLKGRLFTPDDTSNSPYVAVINRTLAHRWLPNQDPIGKQLTFGNRFSGKIVGIVGATKQFGLSTEAGEEVYVPYSQGPFRSTVTLTLRTASDPVAIAAAARSTIMSVDPDQPVSNVRTMGQIVSGSVSQPRFRTFLLGLFAALALVLSAAGIYTLLSYSVVRRTHEIGIRMALGAKKSDILRMVVGEGIKLALFGVVIGIAGAMALTRLLSSMLYGVTPTDPATFIAVSLILIAVALLACYIPARRAANVDPMVALRYE